MDIKQDYEKINLTKIIGLVSCLIGFFAIIIKCDLNLLLNLAEKKTSKNSKIQINIALNYSAKFELISAIKKVKKNKNKINENKRKIYRIC
mgnify:CR=1 FL=1